MPEVGMTRMIRFMQLSLAVGLLGHSRLSLAVGLLGHSQFGQIVPNTPPVPATCTGRETKIRTCGVHRRR